MAGHDQYEEAYQDEYYEEGYDQGYDDEEYYDEEGDEDSGVDYSDADVVRSLPWMAIALVVHAIVLIVFVFIYTQQPEKPELVNLKAYMPPENNPPLPEPEEPPETEVPREEEVIEDPTVDPKITEEAVDENNEDPTETPLNERAVNPNADNSEAESPNPNKGPSSAFGLAGGGGGGGGGGGRGGSELRRARGGGGKKNEERVKAGLLWLAHHQHPDGHWSSTEFMDVSKRLPKGAKTTGIVEFEREGEPGIGWANSVDVGLTGLALLAFVGDGHTHRSGDFAEYVRRGVTWLNTQQDSEGLFGVKNGDEFVYNHAICAMAIAEIYFMSQDRALKSMAQRAVNWIIDAQNPGYGWRYEVRPGVNDSSVTAWMVLALKSAKLAELDFNEEEVYLGANAWYDEVTVDPDGYPTTGYEDPRPGNARLNESEHNQNPAMDACNLMVRIYTHAKTPSDRLMRSLAGNINKVPAKWEYLDLDYYYWYYASLALFQMGDKFWKEWEKNLMSPTLLKYQRGWHPNDVNEFGEGVKEPGDGADAGCWKLDEHGSWDPIDAWGVSGGRVYSTAINTLTLEVYYRYLREFK